MTAASDTGYVAVVEQRHLEAARRDERVRAFLLEADEYLARLEREGRNLTLWENKTWTLVVCPDCGEDELHSGSFRCRCLQCGCLFSRDDERPEDRDESPEWWERVKHRYPKPGRRIRVAEVPLVAGLPPEEAERLIRNCYRALADIYWAATNGVIRVADMAEALERHRPLEARLTDLVARS